MARLSWPTIGGGEFILGEGGRWQLLVVYRGQHCPLCKQYLNTLNELFATFSELDFDVAALSTDLAEQAETDVAKFGWRFPIAFGLGVEEAHQLGLYVSHPRSPTETPRPFAEPGLFVVNPEGKLQVVETSNAPFARPDLKTLLQGLKFIKESGYPVRGTLARGRG
ncbi:MAG: redoxin domain-containing protein [Micropepsaceae bacterium]